MTTLDAAGTRSPLAAAIGGPINFTEVELRAKLLAEQIDSRRAVFVRLLTTYETHDVAQDEIDRTLDLLHSLGENEDYFERLVGQVAVFLPRNQPLYAFTCFVLVPSLMATAVHFRPPRPLRHLLPQLMALLDVTAAFPNVVTSSLSRSEFLRERSALVIDPATGDSRPLTEAVIFTGTPAHVDQLRGVFDTRTLFIANGAGHNPVVVAEDADVSAAVEAVCRVQFYNQGQDCAAPNAVLVHTAVYDQFLGAMRQAVQAIKVGPYEDETCLIGPLTDAEDLIKVQRVLVHNREWLDEACPGALSARDGLVTPAIITKPLAEGGNFEELFAPVMFVQRYEQDDELAGYFEDRHYARHAMYVTAYGTSRYVASLPERTSQGKRLHDASTILRNTHLHAPGVERGTQPYGGFGYGASSISIGGQTVTGATLPQRDIYEYLVRPRTAGDGGVPAAGASGKLPKVRRVDQPARTEQGEAELPMVLPVVTRGPAYLDQEAPAEEGRRFLPVPPDRLHILLPSPNRAHWRVMNTQERDWMHAVARLLQQPALPSKDDFETALYAIPVAGLEVAGKHRRELQRRFFGHLYLLLFGQQVGPRAGQFLWDVDARHVAPLITPVGHMPGTDA